MKLTKRILCIALTLALGLAALALPAAADSPDPYAPIITKAPDFPDAIDEGNTLILEIEAELPDGVEGELSYFWYWNIYEWNSYVPGPPRATGPRLELLITDQTYYIKNNRYVIEINVLVTNTYTDGSGVEQTARTWLGKEIQVNRVYDDIAWWEWLLLPLAVIALPIILPLALIFSGPFVWGGLLLWGSVPAMLMIAPVKWILGLFGINLG